MVQHGMQKMFKFLTSAAAASVIFAAARRRVPRLAAAQAHGAAAAAPLRHLSKAGALHTRDGRHPPAPSHPAPISQAKITKES